MSEVLRRKITMTIQSQVSVQAQVSKFRLHDYQVFAGLVVDKHSIAVTFCNHEEIAALATTAL